MSSRHRFPRGCLVHATALALFILTGVLASPVRAQDQTGPELPIALELFADGFSRPVQIVDMNDGTDRMLVVEQTGTIRVLVDGQPLDTPLLDISSKVSDSNEQGLLSVALHPNFSENGLLFIFYTDIDGFVQIQRWQISIDDPNVANPDSAVTLLSIEHPLPNHNGGLLLFGPDGYLYAGIGDGGGGGDPDGNGQKTSDLFGNILRIDVDNADGEVPYGIPADNPFANDSNSRPEIWLYGLRNPWRFNFDDATGDLYIGDVGQGDYEEIDMFPNGGESRNFGWSIMEGAHCYDVGDCDPSGLELPIHDYSHTETGGCSVVGGYVYHGSAVPELQGTYLFADYCTGELWGLTKGESGDWVVSPPFESELSVSSFGQDAQGELFVVDLDGGIYRIVPS